MFFMPYLYVNPILITAAVLPAIALLIYVYRADKLDKEPPGLLLSLVFSGIFATGLAKFTESLGSTLLYRWFNPDSVVYNLLLYFVVVALSEEGFKYLLLKRRTWNSPYFNCQFDGVVYAVYVSLGFALWENISYVLMYGFGTAILRAVTAVPGHACFGAFMGTFYGIAKKYENRGDLPRSERYRRLAVLVPLTLHGAYDYVASYESDGSTWAFVAFILGMFAVAFLLVRRMSNEDQYID